MEIVIFSIIIVLFLIFFLIIVSLNKTINTPKKETNPSILAGSIIFLLALGVFFFFIFGISSGGGINFFPLIPIFGGAWIPIWIGISNQKKKETKFVPESYQKKINISQKDEVSSTRFCHICGCQYQPNDQFCEMCGASLK